MIKDGSVQNEWEDRDKRWFSTEGGRSIPMDFVKF